MATPDQVKKLLETIGPYAKGLQTIVEIDVANFGIQFEDESWMLVHCNEPAHRLTLSRVIGPAAEQNKDVIHEAILRANALWQQSEGVSVALDDNDQLVILKHVFSEVEPPTLVSDIEDVLDKSQAWQRVIQSATSRTADEPAPTEQAEGMASTDSDWHIKV